MSHRGQTGVRPGSDPRLESVWPELERLLGKMLEIVLNHAGVWEALILPLRWSVPYRVDIRNVADDALDRLVELGAIDAESGGHGEIAALMPDSVASEQIASALGVGAGDILVSPATGRDAGSVWVLSPRPIRIGRLTIVPAHATAEAGALQLIDAAAPAAPDTAGGRGTTPSPVDAVRATAQLDVLHRRRAADGVRLHVMELEKCGLAAPPFGAEECTSTAVAPPHLSAHSGRDMARALGARSRCARSRSLGKAPALETLNQQCERAVEDLGGVTRRHSVPQQRLGAAELVVRFSRHRELNPVALGCERRDARSSRAASVVRPPSRRRGGRRCGDCILAPVARS